MSENTTVAEQQERLQNPDDSGLPSKEHGPPTIAELLETEAALQEQSSAPATVEALAAIFAQHEEDADNSALLLLTGDERPSFAAAAEELLSTARCSQRPLLPDECPYCGEEKGRKHMQEHLRACKEETVNGQIRDAIFALCSAGASFLTYRQGLGHG